MEKFTKQGVRDLNSIPAKPGKKLEEPPEKHFCKHRKVIDAGNGDSFCLDCNTMWDWNGKEW